MKGKTIKNKKILVAIGIVTVCTVLITAGILKLVNNSRTESSVEYLEKSKISNLFNIKQAEGDEDDSLSASRTPSRSSSNIGNSTDDRTSAQRSTTTTKQVASSKAPAKEQSSSSSSQTTPSADENPNTPVTPPPSEKQDEPTIDNKNDEPTVPEKPEEPTTPDVTSGYTITIDNAIKGHIYEAYQIFQGNLYEHVENGVTKKILSDIKWGPDFEESEADIIKALKEKYSGVDEHYYDNCKTAADVADVLAKNEAHAKEFSIIIGNIIKDKNITTTHKTDSSKEDYKITGLESGYYIVVDSQIADKDDAYSRYFLNVVSNVTMEVKSIVPNLGKTVSGGVKIDDTHNTETYYGKENTNYGLTFNLQAMIPTNQTKNTENNHSKEYLAEYANYEYFIVDIVDKGFDLYKEDNKVVVIAKDKDGKTLDIDFTVDNITLTKENKDEYKIEDITAYTGKTIFKITINNLKKEVADGKLNPGDIVTFEYKAKLNGEHNVGDNPNINEAYLIYSDNPHDALSKSRTTENKTYTYSIDLELSKIAELKSEDDEKTYLANAVFEIYNEDKTIKIAELICNSEGELKGYTKYTSLGAGTYYIREEKAPDGYNKLKEDIKLVIASQVDKDAIKWDVTIEKTPEVNKLVHLYNEYNEISNSNGNGTRTEEKDDVNYTSIFIEVENTSGASLPVTGGIGTIIFTVAGLSIMVVAAICLKSNKRK